MADAKITALTANTDPNAADLFVMVDDPAGTPVTKKVAMSDLSADQTEMEAGSSADRFITPAMQHFHPSAAKAWVEATANSTTILASYNITSVTDTATGRMQVNIATDFSGTAWAGQVTLHVDNANGAVLVPSIDVSSAQAAGTVMMESWLVGTTTEALTDPTRWSFVGHGDL